MVAIEVPPPNSQIPISPVFEILPPKTKLRRIFNPTKYQTQATTFRYYGPIGRFDHHRHTISKPNRDPDRGINYWGFTFSCCVVEVFGDTRVIETQDLEVALIELTQPLKLLDLRGSAGMKAGTVSAIAKTANRDLSQAWGRYFYEQTKIYDTIAGLIFSNAHNDEDAIALFERAEPQLKTASVTTLSLSSSAIRTSLLEAAIKNNLIFDLN